MAGRRRKANPLAWLAIGVVVVLVILLIRAVGGGDDWSPGALRVAQDTSKLGRDVAGLRTQLKSIDRLTLFRRLRSWERDARAHLERGRALEPPGDRRGVNGYLLTSLGLRAEALTRFNPSVRNALSDRDLQVAASQLVGVMRDLELGDRSYQLFVAAWPRASERKPPDSRWVPDADDATIEGVTAFVRELRNQPALDANYNLTVASVVVDPKPVGKERNEELLPFTRSLAVSIVVSNTGNQPVPAVPVAAIITSETNPVPETVEGTVGSLRPGEKKSVTLRGLKPTAGGPINLLKVTVGPAGGERNTLDNTQEYKFVMRKP